MSSNYNKRGLEEEGEEHQQRLVELRQDSLIAQFVKLASLALITTTKSAVKEQLESS
jgi:hypothetical protein